MAFQTLFLLTDNLAGGIILSTQACMVRIKKHCKPLSVRLAVNMVVIKNAVAAGVPALMTRLHSADKVRQRLFELDTVPV